MPVLDYLREVRVELSKVIWPNKQSVVRLTLIVFAISGIVAIYVGGVDFLFTKILEILLVR